LNARRLRVDLAPSAFLAIGLVVAHAAAALAVLVAMPGIVGSAIALLVFALGMAYAWGRALHRMPSSVRALEFGGPAIEVELASGERMSAEVSERRYVGRYLVLIALRSPLRRTLLITRDMMDAQSFRRLRIWALWGRLPAVARRQLAA
jgi:hypothetical protein